MKLFHRILFGLDRLEKIAADELPEANAQYEFDLMCAGVEADIGALKDIACENDSRLRAPVGVGLRQLWDAGLASGEASDGHEGFARIATGLEARPVARAAK
jgi:hypothetical protein